MKAIIIGLVVYLGVFSAHPAQAVVCQNKTAIVYGNGMFNSWDNANRSRIQMRYQVFVHLQTFPSGQLTMSELEFHLAYANDSGGFAAGVGTGLEQLLEVARQKVGDSATDLMWSWLAGKVKKGVKKISLPASIAVDIIVPNSPPAWFRVKMQGIASKAQELAYVNDVDLFNQVNGDPLALTPDKRFDGYLSLLKQGKRIVIVSHSQGNFYANRAYQVLTDPITGNAAYAANIGNVAVATPSTQVLAGKLSNNEPYMTVTEDLVIAGVRAVAPTLASKPSPNLWSQNMQDLGLIAWANASIGHNFVTWYLAGTYTRDFIMKGIVDTINGLGGYTGLKYPKKCIQWPPIQTPTSWQKVLTHDWETTLNNNTSSYERRIRDDVNEMMFNAQYNWSTGLVNIQAAAFDNSSSGIVTGSQRGGIRGRFLGFVPIPGGVGAVWSTTVFVPYAVFTTLQLRDFVYSKWNTSIIMESFVWDKNGLTWTSKVSKLALPKFKMDDYYIQVNSTKRTLVTFNVSAYHVGIWSVRLGKLRFIQSDQNHSWLLFAGRDWGEVNQPVAWALIEVKNGLLSASGGLGTSYPMYGIIPVRSIPAFEVPVPVPQARFSSIYSNFNQSPLLIGSYFEECGYMACGGRVIKSLPSVPDFLDVADQRIVGGSDAFIVGQGIQSAPGYYNMKVLVALSRGGDLMNQVGQVYSTKWNQTLQGTFVRTAKDLQFFQW